MGGIHQVIARMAGQIAELQRKQANMVRSGRVLDVDPARQRVKVDIGDADNECATAWIRWTERAGARMTWNPPSPGELMTVISPGGEIDEKSLAIHGGFTDDNAAPSGDGDATVYSFGGVTATVAGGGISLNIAGEISITGGTIKHNGKDIGDTHKHGGVSVGVAETEEPV
ncbi:MAG: hypothetical protein CSA70_03675 [Rhodobacterales bacterium]|nr:MAG: hypothetical protein CSA70_03675 [Rhodobacterales bacterium]